MKSGTKYFVIIIEFLSEGMFPDGNSDKKEETAMPGTIKNVIAAIDYIENHLQENPDLETIAEALHYSKYYLHRKIPLVTPDIFCYIYIKILDRNEMQVLL